MGKKLTNSQEITDFTNQLKDSINTFSFLFEDKADLDMLNNLNSDKAAAYITDNIIEPVAVEIVNIRVIGTGKIEDLEPIKIGKGNGHVEDTVIGERQVTFKVNGKPAHMMTKIYDRSLFKAGDDIQGPAIINQMDTTIVIEPDCVGHVNDYGIIVIDINDAGSED